MDPQVIDVAQVDFARIGEITAPCGVPRSLRCHASIFRDSGFQPFRNQAKDALVRDTMFEETDDRRMGHGIEEALDIRV